jgi:hypothetical protein
MPELTENNHQKRLENDPKSTLVGQEIIDAYNKGYREGYEAGAADNRSRDYNSRRGHDMGQ